MTHMRNAARSASAQAGAICYLVATVQYVLAQVVVQAAWTTPYSWSQNYISDLGNTTCGGFAVPHGATHYICSPRSTLMNASFIVAGVLLVAGTILLRSYWPPSRAANAGSALLIAAGAGKILTGLVPENTDLSLHLLGALNIPLAELGVLFISVSLIRTRTHLALAGIVVGSIGLLGSLLSTGAQAIGPALFLGLGAGGMERLGGYPANIWMFVIGIVVLTDRQPRSDANVKHTTPIPQAVDSHS